MVNERMLELIVMILLGEAGATTLPNIDGEKFNHRIDKLIKEFLEPYVINSTEKSE